MYQSLDFCGFRMAFDNAGRAKQFSYEAQKMIFDFIEDYERDSGEPVELDVIAICCDFSEMTQTEITSNYDVTSWHDVENYLEENTILLGSYAIEGSQDKMFIFQNF